MELNYLREFVVLAHVGHFQEAAELLFISQSSLSKHIKVIESEFKHDLFTRTTRKVELTEFGKSFLPYAIRITDIESEYTNKLLTQSNSRSKKMIIGISPMVTLYNLRTFLPIFSKNNPSYQMEFIEGDGLQLRTMLRQNLCNLIIVNEQSNFIDDEFNKILYTEDHLAVIVSSSHPLANESQVSYAQLDGENYIQLGKTNLLQLLSTNIGPADFTVSKVNIMVDLVEKNIGISVFNKKAALLFKARDVKIIDIKPEINIKINVLYPKNRKVSSATESILAYVRSKADENKIKPKV